MGTERVAIHDLGGALRDINRRNIRQERRPNVTQASDLLGPGFAPRGIQTMDWSEEALTFNGFFWSPAGARNSPDSTVAWAGLVVAETDGAHGVQLVWSSQTDSPVRHCSRRFTDTGLLVRSYTPWAGDTGAPPTTTGLTALSGCTLSESYWKVNGGAAAVRVVVVLTGTILEGTDGNISGSIPLIQLPTEIHPSWVQEIGGGSAGPMTWWNISTDGVLALSAVAPNSVLTTGVTITASGTFLL